jgi:hypothetical protein
LTEAHPERTIEHWGGVLVTLDGATGTEWRELPWSLLREALRAHALGPGGELLVIECRDTDAEDAAVRGRAQVLSLGAGYGVIVELRDDIKDVSLYERVALRDEPRDVLRLTLSPTWTAVVRQAEILSPWQAASVLGWMMPCGAPLLDDYWTSEQALDFWQDVRAGRRRPPV